MGPQIMVTLLQNSKFPDLRRDQTHFFKVFKDIIYRGNYADTLKKNVILQCWGK